MVCGTLRKGGLLTYFFEVSETKITEVPGKRFLKMIEVDEAEGRRHRDGDTQDEDDTRFVLQAELTNSTSAFSAEHDFEIIIMSHTADLLLHNRSNLAAADESCRRFMEKSQNSLGPGYCEKIVAISWIAENIV